MACNSCAKPFTLLRKEKGCPGCGFSYCSKCLINKVFLPKLNAEVKVCSKCKSSPPSNNPKPIVPPDAYYKRLGVLSTDTMVDNKLGDKTTPRSQDQTDEEIKKRLLKLKEDRESASAAGTSTDEIAQRLQKTKGDIPKISDAELQERLARLRGVPVTVVQSQPVLPPPDTRTEQEQADDLLKQYIEQTNVDSKYKDEFDTLVKNMDTRLGKLKDAQAADRSASTTNPTESESEDEETAVGKIVEKLTAEAFLDTDELAPSTNDELPFCEICNEDATLRCLGCHYLFCKKCFMEHRDDDDGCNRYEPYNPPKST